MPAQTAFTPYSTATLGVTSASGAAAGQRLLVHYTVDNSL